MYQTLLLQGFLVSLVSLESQVMTEKLVLLVLKVQ
jgi:hypothetical protein